MQIHRVRGNDLNDALRRARRVHGEKALVVGHESLPGGGVSLSVARSQRARRTGSGFVEEPRVVPHEFPREEEPLQETHVGLREVASHLADHGASPALIQRILGGIDRSQLADHHAIDVAAEAIGGLFRVARAPRVPGRTRLLSLVGAPGSGKTTALVKIAYRLLCAGRSVALATLDAQRTGAAAKLSAWARRLEVPLYAVDAPDALTGVLGGETPPDALLLDTAGDAASDVRALADLAATPEAAHLQNLLVLPASDSLSALRAQESAWSGLDVSGVVVTKLDATRDAATLLEHVLDRELPVAFLSDGRDVAEDFHRATPDVFADLLLRGRLS